MTRQGLIERIFAKVPYPQHIQKPDDTHPDGVTFTWNGDSFLYELSGRVWWRDQGFIHCNNLALLMERLLSDDSGQDITEYALIVAAVGLGVLASVGTMREVLQNMLLDLSAVIGTIGK